MAYSIPIQKGIKREYSRGARECQLSNGVDSEIGRHTEATLIRKKVNQKRHMPVMHGSVAQLIRYVLTAPKANRKQYKLICGNSEYGWSHMEELAGRFGIEVDQQEIDAQGQV